MIEDGAGQNLHIRLALRLIKDNLTTDIFRNATKIHFCNKSISHYLVLPISTSSKMAFIRVINEVSTYHETVNGLTILSPFFTVSTALPVSTTSPVNSWPIIKPVPDG